jgi:hypothetical protein
MASVFILGYTNVVYLAFIFIPMAETFPVSIFVLVPFFIFTVLVYYRGKIWLTLLKSLLSVVLQIIFFSVFAVICVGLLYAFYLMMNVAPSEFETPLP